MAKYSGIHIKPSREGSLHSALGVSQDKKIPAKRLAAAKHSESAAIRKKANFAINAKKWHHKKDGGVIARGYKSGGVITHPCTGTHFQG